MITSPNKVVIIDGVRYLPISDAHPDSRRIKAGLLESWMSVQNLGEVDEKGNEITVLVNDMGEGEPIDDVVADILNAMDADWGGHE